MRTSTEHAEEPAMETASPRKPMHPFLKGLGLVALSGLIVAYAVHERADGGMPPALADAPAYEAEAPAAEPVAQRPSALPARAAALAAAQRGNYAAPDLKAGLAQLHARTPGSAVNAAKREQAVAQMESAYRSEPVDAAWSAASEQSFVVASESQVMARAGFKPQDVSTECRSRTCRISATFDSALDAKDWANRMLVQMGPTIANARVAVLPQPDGRYEVRVFGARKA